MPFKATTRGTIELSGEAAILAIDTLAKLPAEDVKRVQDELAQYRRDSAALERVRAWIEAHEGGDHETDCLLTDLEAVIADAGEETDD